MEHNKIEVAAVEDTIVEAADAQLRDLSELQLTFVGGGSGEVSPY